MKCFIRACLISNRFQCYKACMHRELSITNSTFFYISLSFYYNVNFIELCLRLVLQGLTFFSLFLLDIRSVKCPVRSLLDTPYNGARLRTSLKRAAQIAKASRGRVMTLPAARAPGFLVPYLAPAAYDVAPP